ncbi:MAG: PAS domain S-box protein, partial [bacterium]|nr:PAS domain S-box protein [bacterium]
MTALYTYEPIQSKPLHYILYGTLYLFLLLITNLTHHHEFVIPGLSLTVGYLFGMLLLHRYRDWIILVPMFYLIVNGVNTVLFDFCWKFTLNTALVFLAIVVGVHHTRKFRITIPDFTNMNEFIYFSLYCILILSLVTSFFTSTIYTIFDRLNFNFFFFWLHWWAADAAGVFVVTPLILLSRKLIVEKEFHFEKGRIVEPLITLAVAIVIWYVVFTSKQPNTLFKYYLGLSVLFWIAIRFTVRGLAFFSLIMALIAVFSPDLHHQNKSLSEIYFTHININLYLILTNFLAYTTSALLSERRIAYTIVKQKEEEFHNLYMNTPIGVCRASLDGIIQLANPAFCKLFGYAHDEIIGKNGLDLTHPEDKENFYHHMRLLLDGAQETFQMEKRCVQKNGGIIWADVSANLFKNEEGLPLGFNVHIQEITQQKLFHERLSASEKKFRELFEKSPTGILRTFADGRIESANESALKMLG